MSFLQRVRECNKYKESNFYRFFINNSHVGYIKKTNSNIIKKFSNFFECKKNKIFLKKKFNNFQKRTFAINVVFNFLVKEYPEYKMSIKGCGAIHKIFFNNSDLVENFIDNKLTKREKKAISLVKRRILEAAIIDELYYQHNIFAQQSLSKIVISPSLIIKSKELNYFFDSLEKILILGTENIIKKYINRLKNEK